MATKQKYLSAKWKLVTKSGINHGITGVDIIDNDHGMQLVCCVVKKIRAFQKVSTVILMIFEKTAFFSTAVSKGIKK